VGIKIAKLDIQLPNQHTESLYTVPHSPARQDREEVKTYPSNDYGYAARKSPARGAATGTPEPQILVIFGASGDLTQQAGPSLQNEAGDAFRQPLVGVARRDWSHDYFREHMREGSSSFPTVSVHRTCGTLPKVCSTALVTSTIQKATKTERFLERVGRGGTLGNRVFYLSVSPKYFAEAIQQLGAAGMLDDRSRLAW